MHQQQELVVPVIHTVDSPRTEQRPVTIQRPRNLQSPTRVHNPLNGKGLQREVSPEIEEASPPMAEIKITMEEDSEDSDR